MKITLNPKMLVLLSIPLFLCSCHKETNITDKEENQNSNAVIDHLLFEEIGHSGTVYQKSSYDILYDYDNYIKITNPHTETLYLDSMMLAKCVFSSDQAYTLEALDTRETHFPTNFIMQFPGTGKDYPVRPGESVIIAAYAFDHRTINEESFLGNNPNSYDLSNINFEWETEDQIAIDEDKPQRTDIPNLKLVYSEGNWNKQDGKQKFDIHNGKTSLALIKIKCRIEELRNNKEYQLPYKLTDKGETYFHIYDEGIAVNIPNEWVVDCVCLCPIEEFYRPTVGSKLDKGWTNTFRSSKKIDKGGRGKSVFRKHDGNNFVDLNNSTIDFEVREASLLKKK